MFLFEQSLEMVQQQNSNNTVIECLNFFFSSSDPSSGSFESKNCGSIGNDGGLEVQGIRQSFSENNLAEKK
jgi:hypothetical protein